jgi:hypothetical protein
MHFPFAALAMGRIGEEKSFDAPADMPLLWVLRDILGMTGTNSVAALPNAAPARFISTADRCDPACCPVAPCAITARKAAPPSSHVKQECPQGYDRSLRYRRTGRCGEC